MDKNISLCFDGPDRLGKDSLIEAAQKKLGCFTSIHYQKPIASDEYTIDEHGRGSLEQYQRKSFTDMFKLLESGIRLAINRSHIGEVCYAPRYRGYSGDYVFDLEEQAIDRHLWNSGCNNILYPAKLILLTTSNWDFIEDDGLSFDFSAKEAEQDDFKEAFERSKLPKQMIDITNSEGKRKSREEVLAEVLNG